MEKATSSPQNDKHQRHSRRNNAMQTELSTITISIALEKHFASGCKINPGTIGRMPHALLLYQRKELSMPCDTPLA